VEHISGQFWTELDYGPKSKVEAHSKLYNFRLRCTAIRVTD
jgi:hypothetical protein